MSVLGLVTIGQAPRVDVTPDIAPLLAGVELVERGALDELDADGIAALAPAEGERVLVSRLRGGGMAVLGEERMLPLVQAAIDRVVADGAGAVLLLCTGHLPGLTAAVPLYTAEQLGRGAAAALIGGGPLGVVVPEPEQAGPIAERWWEDHGLLATVAVADPYTAPDGAFVAAGERLRAEGVEWIFLDCIGYSERMRALVAGSGSAKVLLARTLAARLVAEAV
ncbi:AroM family protein [Microbacterium sp. ASV81]|uniref:AroM family protein n=1 Tax=Microbacterium capsulatum TaxID=3041921 RepID=A0ABU0XFE7_9MICO|nr:AroM family protein [Microbacterium sp. ASV81]MDQ4213834.1 AroM family protein [Microbacterium sp. ASV81]